MNPNGTLAGYGLERPCEATPWQILRNDFLTKSEIEKSQNLEKTILEKLLKLEVKDYIGIADKLNY